MKFVMSALALVLAAACGDDDDDTPKASDPLEAGGELWLLETRVYTADESTGYAIPVNELKGDIGNDNGIEQAGGGYIFSQPDKPDGAFLLTNSESGTATRYEVTADNKFVKGKTVSFEDYGVKSGYGIVAWVDAHTAYWLDSTQLQAIRFDPTQMEIGEAFPIDGVERDGYRAWFSDRPAIRKDGVFVTMNWTPDDDAPEALNAPKGSTLVHIDPATDKVTVTSDDRCTSLLSSLTTASGDSYFFSNYENAYTRIASDGERGVPDCALRVRKGESEFDADWSLDITERTGGKPADGVLPGQGSTIWLRVFDAQKLDEQPKEYDEIDSAPAWQWYSLDVTKDDPATAYADLPVASHGTAGLQTDGRSFALVPNEDYSESQLLELKDGKFVELANVVGELNTLIRVR